MVLVAALFALSVESFGQFRGIGDHSAKVLKNI